MRNKILLGILSVVLLASFVAAAATVTYGWLTPGEPVAFDADGSAVAGYFAGGEGTKDEPYLLTTPRHVYNLAWLQYLGAFNETDANGVLKDQYYFKLENDIDMDGLVIPPIGTALYPFVGSFDGNDCIIENAIVANVIAEDEIEAYPPAVENESQGKNTNVQNVEIIGFFGIIGTYGEKGLVSKDQLKDLGVHDLLLDNVTVQTSTTNTLAGLFAGFVNGNLTNVHVTTGTIIARAGASTLSTENVLSAYSLIGDYDTTKINWEGGPMDGPTSDSGTNAGFGGSIDMLSLAKRVTFMMATTNGSHEPTTGYYSPTDAIKEKYHLSGYTGDRYNYSYLTDNNMFLFSSGTYLPLNINTENLQQSDYSSTGTDTEPVLDSNTGFLVGSGSSAWDNSPSVRTRLRAQLCYSLAGHTSSTGWKDVTYDDTKLQILTKDVSGKYYVIGDSHNNLTSTSSPYQVYLNGSSDIDAAVKTYQELNFTQYEGTNNVRGKLQTLLSENTKIHGFQFAKNAPSGSKTQPVSVELGDETVSSLVEGTIHFRVEGTGIMTMVAATLATQAGSITTSGGYHYLPALYQVERSGGLGTGTIEKLTQINTIWTNAAGEIEYNISGGTGWTKVFDYSTMGELTSYSLKYFCNSLFYFEIPVKKGEYVLGGSGSTQTYLLYLDIGGNAGSQGSGGGGNGGVANPTGTLSGVYFVDKDGKPLLQNITPDEGKTAPAVAFQVVLTGTEAKISFDGKVTGVIVTTPPATNVTVTQVVPPSEEDETTGT